MNKALIKKYKAEFEHWMNGGKLLIKMSTGWEPIPLDYTWHLTGKLIIINDEYVEFRKALAEGKIVEFKHHQVGYDEWEIVTPEHLFQSVVPGREYRIKPEEPKFKVGDIVQNFESVYSILDEKTADYLNSNDYCGPSTSLYNETDKIYDEYDKNKYIHNKKNYIEAKGGDGTLIRAIHKFDHLNKPFFGIAAGTENFMMNDEEEINHETAEIVEFNLLKVQVFTKKWKTDNDKSWSDKQELIETSEIVYAFNDVIIGSFNGWINFYCEHKENILGDFKGAGLLISTAQGSTGANKNNHSTIIPLKSKNWAVSGVMTNRNIRYVIEPNELTVNVKSRENIKINVDGKHFEADNIHKVIISKSDINVKVIFNDLKKFQDKRK